MWYYYLRSITVASSSVDLLNIYGQLLALLEEQPFVSLTKSLVIEFSQKIRTSAPQLWTSVVATSFGSLLQQMSALFREEDAEHGIIVKEWCSVLEQVVNFEATNESVCDALEDLAFVVYENPPRSTSHPFFKQILIETLVPLKKACGDDVWDTQVQNCYREVLLMIIANAKQAATRAASNQAFQQAASYSKSQALQLESSDGSKSPAESPVESPVMSQQTTIREGILKPSTPGFITTATSCSHVHPQPFPQASAPLFPNSSIPAQTSTKNKSQIAPVIPIVDSTPIEPLLSVKPKLACTETVTARAGTAVENASNAQEYDSYDSLRPMRDHFKAKIPKLPSEGTLQISGGNSQSDASTSVQNTHARLTPSATMVDNSREGALQEGRISSTHSSAEHESLEKSKASSSPTNQQPSKPGKSHQSVDEDASSGLEFAEKNLVQSRQFFAQQDKFLERIQQIIAGNTPEQQARRKERKKEREARRKARMEEKALRQTRRMMNRRNVSSRTHRRNQQSTQDVDE